MYYQCELASIANGARGLRPVAVANLLMKQVRPPMFIPQQGLGLDLLEKFIQNMNHFENITDNLPIWMDRFYQDDAEEDKADETRPIKLLDANGRKFVWWLCKTYNVHNVKHGIAAQTCQLLERYLAALSTLSEDSIRRQELANRMPLVVSVCVWLSAKMQVGHGHISAKLIRRKLLLYKYVDHPINEINATEMEVFQTVGFRIPIWTTVEKAMLLCKVLRVAEAVIDGICACVDLSEYYRDTIQKYVFLTAFKSESEEVQGSKNIRNSHFAAAAVIACCKFLRLDDPDPVERLAFLTRASADYLNCIASAILKHVSYIEDPTTERKRKRPNILRK